MTLVQAEQKLILKEKGKLSLHLCPTGTLLLLKDLTYCFYTLSAWGNDPSKTNQDSNTQSLRLSLARPGTPALCVSARQDQGTWAQVTTMRWDLEGRSTFPLTASLRMGLAVCEDSVLYSVCGKQPADTTRRAQGEVTQVNETRFLHRLLLQGAWTSSSDPAFLL